MDNFQENLDYLRAKTKVERKKRFINHLIIYIIINSIITGFKLWFYMSDWSEFLNVMSTFDVLSSWIIWGVVLLVHFISQSYGLKWEERKIEELMNEELKRKNNGKI